MPQVRDGEDDSGSWGNKTPRRANGSPSEGRGGQGPNAYSLVWVEFSSPP